MARESGEQFAWRFNDLPSFPALVNVNRTRWETDRCYGATEVLPQQRFPLHRTQTLRITITCIRYKNVCFCPNFHDKKNIKSYEYATTSNLCGSYLLCIKICYFKIKNYFINFVYSQTLLLMNNCFRKYFLKILKNWETTANWETLYLLLLVFVINLI